MTRRPDSSDDSTPDSGFEDPIDLPREDDRSHGIDPAVGVSADKTEFESKSEKFDSEGTRPAGDSFSGGDDLLTLGRMSEDSADIPSRVGEYRIEQLIGSGGMGRVYLATHATMQRTVALKTLPPSRMQHATAVERFYGEIRAAARLLHPNIVTAFDAGCAGGVHFLVMEYVNGPTLGALVARSGPLAIGVAVAAIRDAARGLAHAHAAGIIHRDVKPSNLMRAEDGTVKVVDLGLASVGLGTAVPANQRPSDAGRLIGTIAFMSPEQLENPDAVDVRSDIYSLGATFYFLLTGRPPYEGEFLDQVRGHRHDPLPELFALRPDADLRLEHILHRMMAKRPKDRYGSLVEVIADLAPHDTEETVPNWISGFVGRHSAGDSSTMQSLSTQGEIARVMGIDLGMFFAAAATAEPGGRVKLLTAGPEGKTQHRLAVADGDPLVFGDEAAARREHHPGSVLHCAPLYIGQAKMEHTLAGRRCPAEVQMALQLRHLVQTFRPDRALPRAVAITVPSCYDQLHRQAVLQAAAMAGLRSVRLVDRSLAALQSWHLDMAQHHDPAGETPSAGDSSIGLGSGIGLGAGGSDVLGVPDSPGGSDIGIGGGSGIGLGSSERLDRERLELSPDDLARPQAVVSITGNATEVVIARRRGQRIQQLATVGQWHYGVLQWQQKLVDAATSICRSRHGFDPLASWTTASKLQLGCERAMTRFLLSDTAVIRLPSNRGEVELVMERSKWLEACEPLLRELTEMISLALEWADVNPKRIRHVIMFGQPTRIAANRRRILRAFNSRAGAVMIDRSDIARGAAATVAAELPGRGNIPLPPQPATSHDLGLLVIDAKGRRRIRTIVPRGTMIPARTSRKISSGGSGTKTLTLVESSSWRETSWRSLGIHRLDLDPENPNLEISFEVDMDGQLLLRRRDPVTGAGEVLPPRPQPTLDPAEIAQWADWVADLVPEVKRSPQQPH